MKSKLVSFRVGADEWDDLKTLADQAGYVTLSHFVRHQMQRLKRSEKLFRERGTQLQLAEMIRLRKLIRDCYGLLGRLDRAQDPTDVSRVLEKTFETLKGIDQWSEKFINP